MIASTLKKWRQNWMFLLVVTLLLFVVGGSVSSPYHAHKMDFPIVLRVLGWPLLDIIDLLAQGNLLVDDPWTAIVFFWNAFLWAWALLELKQVLARTFTRRSRMQ